MFDAGQILAANSTHMVAGADFHGTWNDYEWGLTHYVARVPGHWCRWRGPAYRAVDPDSRALVFPPPATTNADVPVFMGLWSNPLDIVTLIKDGKLVRWLVLGGSITNWTGQTVHVAGLHITVLTPGGTIVDDRELNHDFRQLHYADWPAEPTSPTSHGELKDPYVVFVDGMEISDRINLDRRLEGTPGVRLQGTRGLVQLHDARRSTARFPADAEVAGARGGRVELRQRDDAGGLQPARPLPRALQLRPYAARRDGVTFAEPDDDNRSFFCYGEKIHAMADGVVIGATGRRRRTTAMSPKGTTPRSTRSSDTTEGPCIRAGHAMSTSNRRRPKARGSRATCSRWRHRSSR